MAMTPEQRNLIRILVRCIEQVGEEFRHQGADERFWQEADYVSRLFGLLWADGYMYENCPAPGRASDFKVPLVHREIPTRTKTDKEDEMKYDLALFDGKNAYDVATKDIPIGEGWSGQLAENREILVAVEVKPCWWAIDSTKREEIKGDIMKLRDNVANGQIKRGYLLVFCAAREHAAAGGTRPEYPWNRQGRKRGMSGNVAWLQTTLAGLCGSECENVYIYYVSNHSCDAEQHWIPKHPLEVPL